jgi:hypothetical protein
MLSGTPKSLTYRSIGSGIRGTWVVIMYAGEVPGYIVAGDCISCPTVGGKQQVVTYSSVRPLNSSTFGHGVGVCKLSHEVAGRPVLGGLPIQLTHT